MKIAIVSDIHGNLDAFLEVLSDIDASGIDTIVSIGDNIGYGPQPDCVIEQIQSRNIPSVLGNHEMAVTNKRIIEYFNPLARQSILKTIEMLNENAFDYIAQLEKHVVLFDCRFVHGFPPHSTTTYLFNVPDAKILSSFDQFDESLCFIGHTHTLEIVTSDGKNIVRQPLKKGLIHLESGYRYIINCGSVGQPRELNNNAKYVVLDTEKYTIDVRHIPYDVTSVVEKILAAGLPKAHADRLW